MTPASLIIVTDRGSLKGYKVNEAANRGPSLQLVQSIDLTDAHGRYQDKLTDQAGRFAGADGNGRHMGGAAERQGIETENDRRILKQLADGSGATRRHGRLVVRRARLDPLRHRRSAAAARPRADRGACEIRFGEDRPAKLADHFRSLQPI